MAVYGRSYRGYEGVLTPERTRWKVLTRYGLKAAFRSRLFLAFFCLCFVAPLVGAIRIYLAHNLEAINILQLPGDVVQQLLAVAPSFFRSWVLIPQAVLAFFLTLAAGPGQISPDLRNNALPLILARPLSRWEYIFGKLLTLLVLLSAITWVPALALFGLQSYLAGWEWFSEYAWIGVSLLAASWLWILTLALAALAISAWVKWRPVASLLFLALPMMFAAFGQVLNLAFRTHWGQLFNYGELLWVVWAGLLRLPITQPSISPAAAWVMFFLFWGLLLLALSRKVRAYEVERS